MTKPFQSRELVARVSLQVQLGKRRKILEEAFATRLEEVEKRREAAELERKRQELLIDVTSYVRPAAMPMDGGTESLYLQARVAKPHERDHPVQSDDWRGYRLAT